MSNDIEKTWAKSTVLIETPDGSLGTGFLVIRPEDHKNRYFLVTNKHVLHHDKKERMKIKSVKLHMNMETADGVTGEILPYGIWDGVGPMWCEHPDEDVDVLVIYVGVMLAVLEAKKRNLANRFVPEEIFATSATRQELEISVGEDVFVLGYPSGIRQGKTNLPVIRQGIIATRIGEELHEKDQNGDTRVGRGFLIDGGTIHGSSGSPVVLKPISGRVLGNVVHAAPPPPVLLGIIAETRFGEIQHEIDIPDIGRTDITIPSFAGLGFAFDVETIVEVLDIFDQPRNVHN